MSDHGKPLVGMDTPLIREMREEAYRKGAPLSLSCELTLRCNIRCVHCYNFDRDRPNPYPGPELTFEEWKRVFREIKEEGCLFLSLTGGEAMTHPRFWDLMDEASALHFVITVLSNGTLLTDENCDRLMRYPGLMGMSLSLYGATPAVHDAITQAPGSWEHTVRGAERMRDRGRVVNLKFIIMKGNAHEADAMIRMADRMELPYQIDATITGRYDGTAGSMATRVDIPTLAALHRGPFRPLLSKRPVENMTDDDFKCSCARGNGAIFANGNVSSCIAIPLNAGNVRNRSFGEIWRNSPLLNWIRGLRISDFKTCAPCPLRAWCRRSPGPPTALHGDFTGVDPWVCEEAAEIRKILG